MGKDRAVTSCSALSLFNDLSFTRKQKYLTYPYMGAVGVKNCQNYPYVINEWPQTPYSASFVDEDMQDYEST